MDRFSPHHKLEKYLSIECGYEGEGEVEGELEGEVEVKCELEARFEFEVEGMIRKIVV